MCESPTVDDHGPPPLSAAVVGSFAYITIRDRLPVILSRVVDTLECCEELKATIGRLSKLRNEIQTDKAIVPLLDGRSDVSYWNDAIRAEEASTTTNGSGTASWFTSPWLLVECYMYRRIQEALELTSRLKSLDPFSSQKQESFVSALHTIETVGHTLWSTVQGGSQQSGGDLTYQTFRYFLLMDLWGNRCDLSMSCGQQDSSSLSTIPLQQLETLTPNILVDDTELVWDVVRHGIARMDVVLDNAGFELLNDLCFADLLCSFGKVRTVRFHVKQQPWFVSDVIATDVAWTLERLQECGSSATLQKLARRWKNYLEQGQWHICSHIFWTLPHDYSRMKTTCPELYKDLAASQLLLFKGDLNYRKLTGDLQWNPETTFDRSLRGFGPTPLFSLRTLKADVVVGLQPGRAEAVETIQENWRTSGDYAVIQFSPGNGGNNL